MHTHMQNKPPRMDRSEQSPNNLLICGVRLAFDEPYDFIDQAYAAALSLEMSIEDDAELNAKLTRASVQGIATLIHLAAIGLRDMDKRLDRHGEAS